MSTRLTDAELRTWQALLHAHHDIVTRLDADLRREHGLSMESYDILLRLARAPERSLSMSELAERVLAPASTVTRRVTRLREAGLVVRARPDHDSRLVIASITEEGMRRLRRAARTHLRGIRDYFTGELSAAQLTALSEALEMVTGPHQPH
jgi:DNA-binding MarR family transcriptional regulator